MVDGDCMNTFLIYNLIPISLFSHAVSTESFSPIHVTKITCASIVLSELKASNLQIDFCIGRRNFNMEIAKNATGYTLSAPQAELSNFVRFRNKRIVKRSRCIYSTQHKFALFRVLERNCLYTSITATGYPRPTN